MTAANNEAFLTRFEPKVQMVELIRSSFILFEREVLISFYGDVANDFAT